MGTPITSHHDLDVWKASMRLRNLVARITHQLAFDERRDIGNQANRAAQSIPANIAEGHQRPGRADFKNYVSIARGSAAELETHLIAMSNDHARLRDEIKEALQLQDRVSRMLAKLYAASKKANGNALKRVPIRTHSRNPRPATRELLKFTVNGQTPSVRTPPP